MKNLKNNLKNKLKNNKKGFTLVEIIVVLVILAVLAAASIPTMIGFVEDAKGKSEIANARAAYVAAQSVVTEEYAKAGTTPETTALTAAYVISSGTTAPKFESMIGNDIPDATVKLASTNGKITEFKFSNKGYLVTITPGGEAVVKKGETIS